MPANFQSNAEIAERFRQLAALLEIRGEDAFRVRAYRNAAEVIEEWNVSLAKTYTEGGVKALREIPGVGQAISGKIVELLTRGTFDAWERLTAETPLTTLELLDVPGIGIKTATQLHTRFRISSKEDLRQFVLGGGLDLVDGVSDKTGEKIKRDLAI